MEKRKVEINLNDEKGSGLVLALMVLLVLSVLGASLGVVTIGSLQLSDANRDTNSAYYIAEAGANLAYEKLEEIVSDTYRAENKQNDFYREIDVEVNKVTNEESFDPRVGKLYKQFDSQFGGNPTAKVSIEVSDPTVVGPERGYIIKSVGDIDGKRRTVEKKVSVIWKDKPTAGGTLNIPEAAVIVRELSDTDKDSEIRGDVYITNENSNSKEKGKITGETIRGQDAIEKIGYEKIEAYLDDLRNKKHNGDIGNISLESTVNIGDKDVILWTKNLTMGTHSDFSVVGSGTLTIVVTDTIDFKNKSTFNRLNPKRVRIVYIGTNDKDMNIQGEVYAQIIAPYAKVELEPHSRFYGTVISKDLRLKNNSILEYSPYDFDDLGTESGNSDVNLIKPEPAIESD